jgi:uncharacterized protein YndB with AHSA1/START domain
MITQAAALTFTRTIGAAPAEVFAMCTSSAALPEWACQVAQVDPRPGGRVYLWWNQGYYTAGVFTAVTPDRHLAFTWRGPGDPDVTAVQVDFTPAGDGTEVRVTHTGVGAEPAWAVAVVNIARGWEAALENLQAVLETGVDLRLVRRPMFGLSEGDSLTAARAAELGAPVAAGVWIGGTMEGLGAHAAGLQRDDVLVQLDGQPITAWPSLGPVLAAHRPGDRVEAVFYRGPEQRRVTVELSPRPSSAVPESASVLAEATRAEYATLDPDVDALFAGVAEAEADYRPAPDAWTAKQVLAHLIAVERDTHTWITKMIEGGDLSDQFHANDWTRLSALVAVYPTVAELLAELKRSEAATVTMIAHLPPEVARRKYLLRQLADWIPGSPAHVRDHLGELRDLLAAARTGAGPHIA